MAVWSPRQVTLPLTQDQINGLLKKFDKNRDGKVSKEELKVALHSMGFHFCSIKAWRAFRHADANGDGFISDEELNDLLKYASKWGVSVNQNSFCLQEDPDIMFLFTWAV